MSLKEQIEANKSKQEEFRKLQHTRDKGNTYGHRYKNPCQLEREGSLQCIELSHSHPEIDCKPYFENYKKCNQFWLAVQEYRSRVLKKRRFDLPVGEEYEKWKRQLPEWAQTGVLNPPDDENV